MILKIENLGTLKEAQVDLSKDLIVLCGTNNSGKTYMAYSVFGLYDIASEGTGLNTNNSFTEIKTLFEKGNLKVDLLDLYSHNRIKLLDRLLITFKNRLPYIFASSDDRFSNVNTSLSDSNNEISNSEASFLMLEIKAEFRFNKSIITFLNKEQGERNISINIVTEGEIHLDFKSQILSTISSFLSQIIYQTLFNSTYIAPAERIAINIFSKELSIQRNNLVDKLLDLNGKKDSNPIDLLNRRASRYPMAIRESLEIAEDLKTLQSNKSEYSYFADTIEKEILGGKVKISKDGDVEFSPNSLKIKGLGIHLAGSMVKSLSSLVFYFRHLAKKNDFIIIDEPELNLHPDNQIKIAKLIVRFINAGFKVMISTHSDFIIRELNVLMMLKSGTNKVVVDKLVKQYKYADNELLDFNKVGAYFFDNNKNVEIEVTNTGFEVSTIDIATIKQNEASQDIFLKLYND